MAHADILKAAFLTEAELSGGTLAVTSPIDGGHLADVKVHSAGEVEAMIGKAKAAFADWRRVPAPRRGELIRLFGEELRAAKEALGALVTVENGKILQEGLGEVQEMIDICDLAVGQSRQLYGLTIASERPGHAMRESWHPLGVTGVISAFNFPVAVFAWNFALATVCGNTTIWKPSEKTPLTALAVEKIFQKALERFGADAPEGLLQVAVGGAEVGEALTGSQDVPLISATGSTRMGRIVGPRVAERFGKAILELGGNNAMIVAPSADIENATRAIVFSAVGTCGQRCTSLRRLIVHEDIAEDLVGRLKKVYAGLPIGNPLEKGVLVGPLIDVHAFEMMEKALAAARAQGGTVSGGGKADGVDGGVYVHPAIVEMPGQTEIVKAETFAPILYVMTYKTLEEAIALHNDVPQGLSSCIFSTDVRETETFLSAIGSDCGIANVNIGPSGAEIGGAFGGEKETGGGRESGSDAWKAYMRRQTNTVNYSSELPLAQGIKFEI
ncbi:aldehyde dehydrogenase family protein [Pelagibacterium halotolerans]|uniref:L-piperidine-6-carboxylate dehydrogenase n=1 Tax=Pelagibacterium halotolerans TaxID=531813 RepID=UPI00384CEE21